MARLYYRFRSVERLLGPSKELDRQEIYFASPKELNDPMEGLRPIIWRGDSIVWTNLFRHYIRCLHWMCLHFSNLSTTCKVQEGLIFPVMEHVDMGVAPKMTRLHELARTRIFEEAKLSEIVDMLANSDRSVCKIELLYLLQLFHPYAIQGIKAAHLQHGPTLPHLPETRFPHPIRLVPKMLDLAAQIGHDKAAKLMNKVYFGGKVAINLRLRDHQPDDLDDLEEDLRYLLFDFPGAYIETLNQLLYPNWYAACFSKDCTNAVTWASYGDEHKGICLVFESVAESNRQVLPVKRPTRHGEQDEAQVFYDVNYGPDESPIDFFRSMGRIPHSRLIEAWYSDTQGNVSECGSHLGTDEKSWRKEYWEQFLHGVAQKSEHWKHETEARLVIPGLLDDLAESERTVTYEFSLLVEVIFGIRTPDSEKMKVIDVIQKKCVDQGREKFKFSQAYYSRETDRIENYELILYKKST